MNLEKPGGGKHPFCPTFDKNATSLCKGVAILIMVYYHCFGATDFSLFRMVIPQLYLIFGRYGDVCVCFFVMLTGYGFSIAYFKRSQPVPRQIRTRVLKLYQGYWPTFVAVFLLTPINQIHWSLRTCCYAKGTPFQMFERCLVNFLGLSHYVYGGETYTLCQTWWYMSLALILVFALPFLCMLWEKAGWKGLLVMIAAAMLLPDLHYLAYFPAAMLGICMAQSDGFVKLREKAKLKGKTWLGVIVNLVGAFVLLLVWYGMRKRGLFPILADALGAWAISQFAFAVLSEIPVLNRVLVYLGKHSGNIFYIHSFVLSYSNLSGRTVFLLRYDLLIFLGVLGLSLIYSHVLDFIKEKVGWNRLFNYLIKI